MKKNHSTVSFNSRFIFGYAYYVLLSEQRVKFR